MTRTLPIALYLERHPGEESDRFLALLAEARTDPAAQEAVRQRLLAAGILRQTAFIVEMYCQRARRLLEQASPLEPGRGGLEALIDVVSVFPRRADSRAETKEGEPMA